MVEHQIIFTDQIQQSQQISWDMNYRSPSLQKKNQYLLSLCSLWHVSCKNSGDFSWCFSPFSDEKYVLWISSKRRGL